MLETNYFAGWMDRASEGLISRIVDDMDISSLIDDILDGVCDEPGFHSHDFGTLSFCINLVEEFNKEKRNGENDKKVTLFSFLTNDATYFTVMQHFDKKRLAQMLAEVQHIFACSAKLVDKKTIASDSNALSNNELGLSVAIHYPEIFRSYLESCEGGRRDFFQAAQYITEHSHTWQNRLELLNILHTFIYDTIEDQEAHQEFWYAMKGQFDYEIRSIEETGVERIKKAIQIATEASAIVKDLEEDIAGCCASLIFDEMSKLPNLTERMCFLEKTAEITVDSIRTEQGESDVIEDDEDDEGLVDTSESQLFGEIFDFAKGELLEKLCVESEIEPYSLEHIHRVMEIYKYLSGGGYSCELTYDILEDIVMEFITIHPKERSRRLCEIFDFQPELQIRIKKVLDSEGEQPKQ